MWLYEPGPLAPLDPSRFPQHGVVAPDIEQAVVPQSAALLAHEQRQGTLVSEMAGAGVPDVDGDHARVLAPAYDEVATQEAERWALTTDEAVNDTQAGADEFQGLADQLPAEDSDYTEPQIPGEGDDTIPESDNPVDLGINIDNSPGGPSPPA